MHKKIQPWLDRVTMEVLSADCATMRVRVHDKGTRRTWPSVAGVMTLTRHADGHWHVAAPFKIATWADAELHAWCKRVGGGMYRTVALVRAAQRAYLGWELEQISKGER